MQGQFVCFMVSSRVLMYFIMFVLSFSRRVGLVSKMKMIYFVSSAT